MQAHRAEVDADAVWAAIEPAVDGINKKKRKRRFVFWLFAGALLLSGSGAGYWYLFRTGVPGTPANDQIVSSINHQTQTEPDTPHQAGDLSGANESSENDSKSENKPGGEPANAAGNEQQIARVSGAAARSDRKIKASTPGSATIAAAKKLKNPSNNAVSGEIPGSAPVHVRPDHSDSAENKNSANPVTLSAAPDQNQETRLLPPNVAETRAGVNTDPDQSGQTAKTADARNSTEPAGNTGAVTEPSGEDSIIPGTEAPVEPAGNPATDTEPSGIAPAATVLTADAAADTTATAHSDENNPLIPPAPPARRKTWQFSAALQGGIAFTDRKLEPASDSTGSNLLSLREKTERPLETTQLGLLLEARHQSGFELATGLHYTRINERFQYLGESVETDTVNGIQFLVRNLYGEIDTIFGGVPLKRTTTFRKEYYNHINLIEIPLLVGYRTSGSDLSFGVRAGVFLNLKTTATGQVLDFGSVPVNIEDAGIIKTKIGLSYYLGLSASYKVTDNLEIYVSPFARVFPKSLTEDSYALRQKYRLYGLSAGVRLGF